MSFFNRLKAYPEFHEMNDALDLNRVDEVNIIESNSHAFGSSFEKFISSQPETLQKGLNTILQSSKTHISTLQDQFVKLTPLTKDVNTFLTDFNQKKGKQDENDTQIKYTDNMKKELNNLEEKLHLAQSKSKQQDVDKLESQIQIQKRNIEIQENKQKSFQENFDKINDEYSKKIIIDFSSMFIASSETRQKASKKISNFGQEIYNASLTFEDFEDQTLNKLQEKLKEYEQELLNL